MNFNMVLYIFSKDCSHVNPNVLIEVSCISSVMNDLEESLPTTVNTRVHFGLVLITLWNNISYQQKNYNETYFSFQQAEIQGKY